MNTRAFLYLYIYTIDKSSPPKIRPRLMHNTTHDTTRSSCLLSFPYLYLYNVLYVSSNTPRVGPPPIPPTCTGRPPALRVL